MGSTEPDRSLSSGIPLPQWMKSKIGDRYDLDETFSPPSYDDSFFYIRYPKSDRSTRPVQKSELVGQTGVQDFSQLTTQCRQFVPDKSMPTTEAPSSLVKATRNLKPAGTDDNFTGEAVAACSKSVVQVAHQMIASNLLTRGFSTSGTESPATGEGFNRNMRRGSKSLPSSPLSSPPHSPDSSPQTRRKIQNRYFTGAFTLERANMHPSGGQESANKYPGSWLLSGILGQQREHLSDSMDSVTIPEEEHKPYEIKERSQSGEIRRNKSMTSMVTRMLSEGSKDDGHPVEVEVGLDVLATKLDSPLEKKAFRAKPSELREMNFWSPTSM
ncbi:hypothetical protein L9F63_017007 [Diploptera punctata]|uniref:Uncharacterized protein n=1 Tax=Diploptera punctata TaxID=6984 RepID=A0AAD7ZZX2_DIPPU|nr:hypothetical protein L9F63_017007 [Diploptera punctata]